MTIVLIILCVLAAGILGYWYIGMLRNLFKSFKTEVEGEINKLGGELIEFRKARDKDWSNSPFPKFEIEPAILINGLPSDQSFYRIITYRINDDIKNAWVEVNTSPFRNTQITIKEISK